MASATARNAGALACIVVHPGVLGELGGLPQGDDAARRREERDRRRPATARAWTPAEPVVERGRRFDIGDAERDE